MLTWNEPGTQRSSNWGWRYENLLFKTVCHSVPGIIQYDAKLLKLQKQSARNQAPQSSSFNNEIFRKVDNFIVQCLTESCKEIICGDVETATCQSWVWEGDKYTTKKGGRAGKTAGITATTNHKEEKNLLNHYTYSHYCKNLNCRIKLITSHTITALNLWLIQHLPVDALSLETSFGISCSCVSQHLTRHSSRVFFALLSWSMVGIPTVGRRSRDWSWHCWAHRLNRS